MNITITATLTEEQIEILSNAKGYQPTVSSRAINEETQLEELTTIPNPQSRADFIAEQYNGLIAHDAENEYIRYAKKQREEAELAETNLIKDSIKWSLTVNVSI